MMFLHTLSFIVALLMVNDIGASNWWNSWSPGKRNERYQRETLPVALTTTKTEFKQLWYTKLNGPVQVSPTIYQRYVYVSTSNNGTLYCLDADNGTVIWQRVLSTIINNGQNYISRTSPLIEKDMIILGLTDLNLVRRIPGNGSYVMAFNRFTGELVWQRKISTHPASTILSTPQVAKNRLFVGISSLEEGFAEDPTYPCCTFQGSVVALNVSTGEFLWETKMIPDNGGTTTGYSGAAVWGSQFPVDCKRNQIYIATGNYYNLPASIQNCVDATNNLTVYSDPCQQPGAYGEAVLALDMRTGIVRWSQSLGPANGFTVACLQPASAQGVNCPSSPGNDSDFGQAPILKLNLKYKFGGDNRDQLFVGQKSGVVYGIDATTGTVIWSNQVSPNSPLGGIEFGSAADNNYIYVGSNNGNGLSYTLSDGTTTRKASWSALDLVTGDIKWTTVDPTTNVNQTSAYLPLTVWDQLVLVQGGSSPAISNTPIKGCIYGLNKINGQVLYEQCIENTPIGSGASVARDTIYIGIGYRVPRATTDGLMALQLPLAP